MFLDLGWGFESVVTAVAVHPRHDAVPAGYKDGAAILVHTGRRTFGANYLT